MMNKFAKITSISRKTARNPEIQKKYDEFRKKLFDEYGDNIPCVFCDQVKDRIIIEENSNIIVCENDYPYEFFDGRRVVKHLMIIPQRHLALMADFSEDEILAYWELLSKYSKNGASSMTRSAIDEARSVPKHLHTHLLFYA